MSRLSIVWIPEDELENIKEHDISFSMAREVLLNQASLRLPNIAGDHVYLGCTDNFKEVLFVYCKREEEFTRIVFARRASKDEKNAFFKFLARI